MVKNSLQPTIKRCEWAQDTNKLMQKYHDDEWGVATTDSQKLFELLTLEIFQSGLSWQIILKKRSGFRRAFAQFQISKVAQFNKQDINNLLDDVDIVRNRRKIEATVNNAKVIQHKFPKQQFSEYLWSFTGKQVIKHAYDNYRDIPRFDSLAVLISQSMRQYQFQLIGPVTIYSFLQASGIINDHCRNCFKCFNI